MNKNNDKNKNKNNDKNNEETQQDWQENCWPIPKQEVLEKHLQVAREVNAVLVTQVDELSEMCATMEQERNQAINELVHTRDVLISAASWLDVLPEMMETEEIPEDVSNDIEEILREAQLRMDGMSVDSQQHTYSVVKVIEAWNSKEVERLNQEIRNILPPNYVAHDDEIKNLQEFVDSLIQNRTAQAMKVEEYEKEVEEYREMAEEYRQMVVAEVNLANTSYLKMNDELERELSAENDRNGRLTKRIERLLPARQILVKTLGEEGADQAMKNHLEDVQSSRESVVEVLKASAAGGLEGLRWSRIITVAKSIWGSQRHDRLIEIMPGLAIDDLIVKVRDYANYRKLTLHQLSERGIGEMILDQWEEDWQEMQEAAEFARQEHDDYDRCDDQY